MVKKRSALLSQPRIPTTARMQRLRIERLRIESAGPDAHPTNGIDDRVISAIGSAS
jgi:hypothetical protein